MEDFQNGVTMANNWTLQGLAESLGPWLYFYQHCTLPQRKRGKGQQLPRTVWHLLNWIFYAMSLS